MQKKCKRNAKEMQKLSNGKEMQKKCKRKAKAKTCEAKYAKSLSHGSAWILELLGVLHMGVSISFLCQDPTPRQVSICGPEGPAAAAKRLQRAKRANTRLRGLDASKQRTKH